jgi:predicted amidophosphoribosyltransferase
MIHYTYNRLFSDLTPSDKLDYSAAKLGYLPSIKRVSRNIYASIKRLPAAPIVASVPHQHRGFLGNPAEEIGRNIAEWLGVPQAFLERDLAPGQSQYFYYTAGDRLAINQRTIWADPVAFSGKDVILVDDLRATGAVLDVSTEKLIDAGATTVDRFVDLHLGRATTNWNEP